MFTWSLFLLMFIVVTAFVLLSNLKLWRKGDSQACLLCATALDFVVDFCCCCLVFCQETKRSRSLSERRGGLGRIIRDLNGGVENLYPYF